MAVVGAVGLTGCGKPEPEAADPAVAVAPVVEQPMTPAAGTSHTPVPEPVELRAAAVAPTVASVPAPETAVLATPVKVPDLQTASVKRLGELATRALTNLGVATAATSPALSEQVNAVKTSMAANDAKAALASLGGVNQAVKGNAGAEGMAASVTQLVSAWALKQGFDVAKISGVLGALQKQDYAALATQASGVMAQGGVTGEQQDLLKGVLNAYGIDATKAAGAVGTVKGLFAK